ncbi:MAG: hypothetical protein ACRCY9_15080, partial [Phycicoccus sp.]
MSSSLPYLLIGGGLLILLLVVWLLVRQMRGSGSGPVPAGPVDMTDHVERLGRSIPRPATSAATAPDVAAAVSGDAAPASPWRRPGPADAAAEGSGDEPTPAPAQASAFAAETPDRAPVDLSADDETQAGNTLPATGPETGSATATDPEEPGRSPEPAVEFEEEPVSTIEPENNVVPAAEPEHGSVAPESDAVPADGATVSGESDAVPADGATVSGESDALSGESDAAWADGATESGGGDPSSADSGTPLIATGADLPDTSAEEVAPESGPGPEHGVVDSRPVPQPAAATWSAWSAPAVADSHE